jgi:hypothetical protein
MEIKRKFEISAATKRRYVVHRPPSASKPTVCLECGAPMLTIEQTANMLGIKQRRIFQIIEIGAIHFTESEAGVLMICLTSLVSFLENV